MSSTQSRKTERQRGGSRIWLTRQHSVRFAKHGLDLTDHFCATATATAQAQAANQVVRVAQEITAAPRAVVENKNPEVSGQAAILQRVKRKPLKKAAKKQGKAKIISSIGKVKAPPVAAKATAARIAGVAAGAKAAVPPSSSGGLAGLVGGYGSDSSGSGSD